jgi:hypothetical protein
MDEEKLSPQEERRLLEMFEQSSLEDYPNPDREGCPETAFVRKLAFDRKSIPIRHPDLTHVARCSPCFREFLAYRKQAARHRILKRVAALAAIVLLAIGLGVFSTAGSGNLFHQRDSGAYVTAHLDLRNFLVLRGIPDSGSTPATESPRLPRHRLTLTVTLPLASQAGRYEVEVQRDTGKPLAIASGYARIESGLTLMSLKIDLSNLLPGEYVVAIRRTGRDWSYYPVRVEEGLETGGWRLSPIVAKDEFIQINLELIATDAVIISE